MGLPCMGNHGVTAIMTDVSDLGKCILRSIFKRCTKELALSVICPRAFLVLDLLQLLIILPQLDLTCFQQ